MGIISKLFFNESKENNVKLSKFKKNKISNDILKKYKQLRHIRENQDGYVYTDNDNIVAVIATEKNKDEHIWITGLEVFNGYKGNKLSYQLLDVATKELRADRLSVRKTNKLAYDIYIKYGFKVYDETDYMYFMEI